MFQETNSFSGLLNLNLALKTLKRCHQTKKGKLRKLFLHSQTKREQDGKAGQLMNGRVIGVIYGAAKYRTWRRVAKDGNWVESSQSGQGDQDS